MLDTDLLVSQLRAHGHVVSSVIKVPDNAGEYEFAIDGVMLPLDEARLLLERDLTPEASSTAARPLSTE